jgi:hypothetical protein
MIDITKGFKFTTSSEKYEYEWHIHVVGDWLNKDGYHDGDIIACRYKQDFSCTYLPCDNCTHCKGGNFYMYDDMTKYFDKQELEKINIRELKLKRILDETN